MYFIESVDNNCIVCLEGVLVRYCLNSFSLYLFIKDNSCFWFRIFFGCLIVVMIIVFGNE